ncbi:MAG: serine/threonine protein kinase, partial [Chloroflexi bacterium]|nr:serine/threonine protein kinase [Chloroflexota bacterium]
MIGETIGQYQIIEIIGQGGMATVYKAFQPSVGRHVAIKILPRQLAEDPTFLKRLEREAQVVGQIEHRSIVPIYDYGYVDRIPYIVMRYIDGGTLRRKMFYDDIDLRDAARMIGQVAEGLDFAHQSGVLHRDIKPSNILLDSSGNAYLTDFGIAKLMGSASQITGSGVVGTPSYMSPEQCRGKELGPTSDIYALGAILFELTAGHPPFEADTPLSVMYMHVRDPIPDPLDSRPDLPPDLTRVFQTALAKKPQERYPTAQTLAADYDTVVSTFYYNGGSLMPLPKGIEEPTPASSLQVVEFLDQEFQAGPAAPAADPGYIPSSEGPPQTRTTGRQVAVMAIGGILIIALVLGLTGIGLLFASGNQEVAGPPPLATSTATRMVEIATATSDLSLSLTQSGGLIEPTDAPPSVSYTHL